MTAVQRYFGSITSMTSKRFKPFHVKSTKQFKLTKNKKKNKVKKNLNIKGGKTLEKEVNRKS